MGRERDSGVKWGGIAGFENPYCGPSLQLASTAEIEIVHEYEFSDRAHCQCVLSVF